MKNIEQSPYNEFRDEVAEKAKKLRSEGKREAAKNFVESYELKDSLNTAKIYQTLEALTGKKFFAENDGVEFFIDKEERRDSLASLLPVEEGFKKYEERFYRKALVTAMEQDDEFKDFIKNDSTHWDGGSVKENFLQELGSTKEDRKVAAEKLAQNLGKAETIIHEKETSNLVSKINAATVWEKYKDKCPSFVGLERTMFNVDTGYHDTHGCFDQMKEEMTNAGATEEEIGLASRYMWNSAIDRKYPYTEIFYNLQRTEKKGEQIPEEVQIAVNELIKVADPEKSGIFLKSFMATYIGGYGMNKPGGLKSIVESKLLDVSDGNFLVKAASKNAEQDVMDKILEGKGNDIKYNEHPINGEKSIFRNFEDRAGREKDAVNKAFEQLCKLGKEEVDRREETTIMENITNLLRTAAENGIMPDHWREKITKALEFGRDLPSVWRSDVRRWRYERLGQVEAMLNALENKEIGLAKAGFEQKTNSTGSMEMYLDGELVAVAGAPIFSEKPTDGKIVCWMEVDEIDNSSIAGSQFAFRIYLAKKGQKEPSMIYQENYWANKSDMSVSAPIVDEGGKIHVVEIRNGERKDLVLNG